MSPERPTTPAGNEGRDSLHSAIERLEERFAEVEPTIQAFLPEEGRFERLRREVDELLARYPQAGNRPPLFGVLLGVKDIFHVEGLPTRAGSRLPPEELAGPEADVVTSLKAAGALVVGKTVSTEFAYFAPGPTRNPHAPDHTPGGSSSGSAAAVAAGLCQLGLGTQTIGSISRPAAFCGITGYKPSLERISREGVIPLSPSLDHVGLLAPQVAGVAAAAALLCRDWRPRATVSDRPALAVPEGPYLERASSEGLQDFRSACDRLRAAGYSVRSVPALADFEQIEARHHLILAAEAAAIHNDWFERYRELYHQKTAELIQQGRQITLDEVARAIGAMERLQHELTFTMDEEEIDLWISPAAVGAAPEGLDGTGDPTMNLPWTHCGLPTLAVPSSRNAKGLPLGLQIAGRWQADEELMIWGTDLEEALGFDGGSQS